MTAYKRAVDLFGVDTIKTAVDMLGLGGATPDGSDSSDKKKSQADRLVELAAEFGLFRAPGEEESGYAFNVRASAATRKLTPIEDGK